MRFLMVFSGLLLWLNAFVCRAELWEAYRTAAGEFERALHSGNLSILVQGFFVGLFMLISASPAWKLFAGGLFLKLSLDDPQATAQKPVYRS